MVGYKIIAENLPALRLTSEQAEIEIILYIFKPLFIERLDFISSIYSSLNAHFYFLEEMLAHSPSGIRFKPYDDHKIKALPQPAKKIITENVHILMLDDLIIIITA